LSDPIGTELALTTLYEVWPRVVKDHFFLNSPKLAHIRDHCSYPYDGGQYTQTAFIYAPLIGAWYAIGDNFNITKPQTIGGTVFTLRQLEVNVSEFKENLSLNRGPLAVFSLLQTDLKNAILTASAMTAIASWRHGQANGATITDNRQKMMNGDSEAINDGITNSWDGNVFPTYGTATRNGVIGSVLNSVPLWVGDSLGNPGKISYPVLEEAYQDVSIGQQEPDLIVATKASYAYMKERIQEQQRFSQERDPIWGVTSFRFNSAMVLKDDYAPSTKYGKNDPILGSYLPTVFTTAAAPDATSNLPASTLLSSVGETIFMYNTKELAYRLTTDPELAFGFTGFKPAQDNTRVAGQVLAQHTLEYTSCRLHKQLYGINA